MEKTRQLHQESALLTLAFVLLTTAPRLKAAVSIFDALMTSAPIELKRQSRHMSISLKF